MSTIPNYQPLVRSFIDLADMLNLAWPDRTHITRLGWYPSKTGFKYAGTVLIWLDSSSYDFQLAKRKATQSHIIINKNINPTLPKLDLSSTLTLRLHRDYMLVLCFQNQTRLCFLKHLWVYSDLV